RHAERGVALQVLDRDEALAVRKPHIVSGDVVLEVYEALALCLDLEDRRGVWVKGFRLDIRQIEGFGLPVRCRGSGGMAFGDRSACREAAGEGTGTDPS